MTPNPQPIPAATHSPVRRQRLLTHDQGRVVQGFVSACQIDPDQIGFDGDRPDPIFDYEALMILANTLGDFREINITPSATYSDIGIATAECFIVCGDGTSRRMFGAALIGELLPDGTPVKDWQQAFNLARARALRSGLRSVSFDPVRALAARQGGTYASAPAPPAEDENRRRDLAAIHLLARETGYITETGDESEYRRFLSSLFPGKTSACELSDQQRRILANTLRSLRNSQARARRETPGEMTEGF